MNLPIEPLLACLQQLPDPRRPQGRRYPLAALLGLVLLGTLHGQSSLRGIWVWSQQHWPQIWQPLGFRSPPFSRPHYPLEPPGVLGASWCAWSQPGLNRSRAAGSKRGWTIQPGHQWGWQW